MKRARTPEQDAAMQRAHKPKTHPWRAWKGTPKAERDPQIIVPRRGRLVRA